MKKLKPTVQNPIIEYLTIANAIRENDTIQAQHLLHQPSSQKLILLIRDYTANISSTLMQSTRVSNASISAKLSEHLRITLIKTKDEERIGKNSRLGQPNSGPTPSLPIG